MMPRSTWMSLALAGCLMGCAARGDIEILESENRQHEDLIAALEDRLEETRNQLDVARKETAALHAQLHANGEQTLVAEQVAVLHRVEKISFHRLLTSGLDMDGQPGDDGISVMLMPLDKQGDLVKLPGAVEFELLDLTLPADQQRIGQWNFTLKDAEVHWQRGFLSAGYLFHLPWQGRPSAAELTLHGRFLIPDGRKFEATSQVKIAPPQANGLQTAGARRMRPKPLPYSIPEGSQSDSDSAVIHAGASEGVPTQPGRSLRPVRVTAPLATPTIPAPRKTPENPPAAKTETQKKLPESQPPSSTPRVLNQRDPGTQRLPEVPPYGEELPSEEPPSSRRLPEVPVETSNSFSIDDLPVRR